MLYQVEYIHRRGFAAVEDEIGMFGSHLCTTDTFSF